MRNDRSSIIKLQNFFVGKCHWTAGDRERHACVQLPHLGRRTAHQTNRINYRPGLKRPVSEGPFLVSFKAIVWACGPSGAGLRLWFHAAGTFITAFSSYPTLAPTIYVRHRWADHRSTAG